VLQVSETTKSELNHVEIWKGHERLIREDVENRKKRKRASSDAMNTEDAKTNSQPVEPSVA
jgi:hypothetical protein